MNILANFRLLRYSLVYILLMSPFFLDGSPLPNHPYSDYRTDESGHVFMYVNVIGHVKSPGSFLIYENMDLLSIISAAGGTLPGAKLGKIIVYRKNSEMMEIDLQSYFKSGNEINIIIKPNDTIYIQQSLSSYVLSKTTILNTFLSIINIYIALK